MNKINLKAREASKIKDEIVEEVINLNHGSPGDVRIRPNLAIIAIGEVSSELSLLEKEGVKVGVDTHSYLCPANSDEEEIIAMIECLNEDDLIDGIYFCPEVPEKFDFDSLVSTVTPSKELNSFVEGVDDEDMRTALLFRICLENLNEKKLN